MLSSPRVNELIPNILRLGRLCEKAGASAVVFGDCHTKDSPEFESYPRHCIKGTSESEIVDELKELKNYTFIAKNSTLDF
jgi:nicotinamidase-related amidase